MPIQGRIKNLVADKGYGFISPDDGTKDIFFHLAHLREGVRFEDLEAGQEVDCEVEKNEKGIKATDVFLVDP